MNLGILDRITPEERAALQDVLARCPVARLACETHAAAMHAELARHAVLTVALRHAPSDEQADAAVALDILTESALTMWTRPWGPVCDLCGDLPEPEILRKPRP